MNNSFTDWKEHKLYDFVTSSPDSNQIEISGPQRNDSNAFNDFMGGGDSTIVTELPPFEDPVLTEVGGMNTKKSAAHYILIFKFR